MSEKQKYEVTGLGLDYPSVKDGKRRMAKTGDVVDDLPPNDIKRLLKVGAIALPGGESTPAPQEDDAVELKEEGDE